MSIATTSLMSRSRCSDRASRARPRTQVHMTKINAAAINRGTKPPWKTFSRLAARKPLSTSRNGENSNSEIHSGCRRSLWMASTASSDEVIIAPTTEIPYAPARALDEPKPSTKATTPISRIQLICGT